MANGHRYTARIPSTNLGSLGYQNFIVFKDQLLGRGSYGTVYKAMCDNLPCAAKILHPTLVDNGSGREAQKFEKECEVMSRIRHPNIVLYLGLRTDPETRLPVLLMELLDESLTSMLEQSPKALLPYHIQVDICYDVALALSYLHSHNIIHRDLSSNNVLITAKRRAKVTDFGMSRIVNPFDSVKMTMCPGTQVYMPPEALNDLPDKYTNKLDVFSFGVIIIQVLTRLFPDPTPRAREVNEYSHLYPQRRYQIIVPERERRRDHINLIDPPTHPLLSTALDCICDDPKDRPETSKLCKVFTELKKSPLFVESMQGDHDSATSPGVGVGDSFWTNGGPWLESTQLKKEIYDRDKKISSLLQEIAHLQQMNQKIIEEKERLLSTKELQIIQLKDNLRRNEQHMADFQKRILDLQEQLKHQQKQHLTIVDHVAPSPTLEVTHPNTKAGLGSQQRSKVKLQSLSNAPISLHRGASAVHYGRAYFTFGNTLLSYNMQMQTWNKESDCPQANGGFTIVGELPTMIGGDKGGQVTSDLVSLIDGLWIETFPNMPTPRVYSSAIVHDNHLIVAGGSSSLSLGADILSVVEVMKINDCQSDGVIWSTVASLIHPLADASVVALDEELVLLGGTARNGKNILNLVCDLSTLLNSRKTDQKSKSFKVKLKKSSKKDKTPPVWEQLPDNTLFYSTGVLINHQLFVVGGCDAEGNSMGDVYRYDSVNGSWEKIGLLNIPRLLCHVVCLPGDDLMVVGGCEMLNGPLTNAVEISTIL